MFLLLETGDHLYLESRAGFLLLEASPAAVDDELLMFLVF
jgi:hypothetical protein